MKKPQYVKLLQRFVQTDMKKNIVILVKAQLQ